MRNIEIFVLNLYKEKKILIYELNLAHYSKKKVLANKIHLKIKDISNRIELLIYDFNLDKLKHLDVPF